MNKKFSIINLNFLLSSILIFTLIFSIMAPTIAYAAKYNEENETMNNITGDVIDFSDQKKFDFSKSTYEGTDNQGGKYKIEKQGTNYIITLNNFTAKKIILPYDDADNGEPTYQKSIPRKTHITIELIGKNKVTGYGISGGYTKGVTIKGSGSLDVQAFKEIKTERSLNMSKVTEEQRKDKNFEADASMYSEEEKAYIVPGIVLETDEIDENDPNSGLIFEAEGEITINSPFYWGIICNGDIKIKEGSHVSITAIPAGNKVADSGAISADRIIKESADSLSVDSGKILESKPEQPKETEKQTEAAPKDTSGPVITGEGITEGGTYCENPIITVEDNKQIANITVNKVGITKFIEETLTKKTFAIPTYLDDEKTIVATDSDGNKTTFKFTSHNGHITLNGTEKNIHEATCTNDGSHEVEYKCKVCNEVVKTEKIIDKALGHSFGKLIPINEVQSKQVCDRCGYTEVVDTGVKMENTTVSLSQSNYVYDGTAKQPIVTVKYKNSTLVNGRDYAVEYKNNIEAGTAVVTVTGKDKYKGQNDEEFIIQKADNEIKASNFTKNYSKKAQSFSINATQTGNANLTYVSDNDSVVVNDSGKVTMKAGFTGKATITITASETDEYNGASKKITITTKKINNTITASNYTKNYSKKAQSFSINAKQAGDAKLTYTSDNKSVVVNDLGKVTIKAGFSGKATITIVACETEGYNKAIKQISITMKKINNSITASNFTRNYSKNAQSFSIGAKQVGNAKLTYSSNNKNITVNSSGKVKIAKGFIGKATITITANATEGYNKATKKITITVNPPTITGIKLSNSASKKMTVKWSKNTAVTGYQIQYSTDKNFKKNTKTIKVSKNGTVSSNIKKLTKNKTYYVRVRGYKTVSKVNYYSAWSSVKSIKIKK